MIRKSRHVNENIANVSTARPSTLLSRSTAIALLFLVAIWSVAYYELKRSEANLIEQAEIRTEQEARALAEYARSNFKRIDELLLDLRAQRGDDWRSFGDLIKKRQEAIADIAFQVATMDRDGFLAFTNLAPPAEKTDLHEREHFKVHAQNPGVDRLFISKPVKGKVSGKWSIQFTRPMFKADKFDGVLVVSVAPSQFSDLAKSLGVKEAGTAAMVRDTGEVMSRYPNGETFLGSLIKGTPYLSQDAPVSGTFRRISNTDGIERIFGYYRMADYGVNFSIGESLDVALQPYKAHRNAVLTIAILISALTCILFLQLMHSISVTHALAQGLAEESKLAKQANAAKSQFLANMSHEIRTPMNAILGMLSLLGSTELTARQRDYASKADGAAQSLLGLLNDILDVSKVDAGKMTLESLPFRLDTLMRNLSVVLSSNIKSKNIEVLFDIDPELPDVLVGDAMRLQQVLINLGGNAIKFTENGQVVVGLKKMPSKAGSTGIAFSVRDSGIGIAPEHQARIFDSFSQAEASTTRRYGGSGLGLSISKGLVDVMGGNLRLESTPGSGSTFGFEVEFPNVTEIPAELQLPIRSYPSHQRVLIVDDNAIANALLLKMVRSMGWEGEWTAGGREALAKVQMELRSSNGQFPYSVVLMDWQMQEMDGWETSRQMRKIAGQCSGAPPVIVMLSDNGRQDLSFRTEEEQALVNGFLVKPVTASMIFDAVMDANSENPSIRRISAGRASKRQLANMRILVVEDNLINQQVADELLSAEGAIVSLAANGHLGVDAVRMAVPQFDAVLMDMQMPEMDGYAATGVIRKELGLLALPIIAMTANALPGDREACIAAGMNEHIGKPFDITVLVSLLIRVTGFQVSLADQSVEEFPHSKSFSPSLRALEGLDLEGALARMAGIHALYARTARDFLNILASTYSDLKTQLEGDDQQLAIRTLHTLKGNAGTLGVTALAMEAKRLEQLCRSEHGCEKCLQELNHLRDCIGQAQSLLKVAIEALALGPEKQIEPAGSMPQPADTDALSRALEALESLLQHSDMDALEVFAASRPQWVGLPDELYKRLDDALQALDFEAAHQTCLEAQKALRA